jgi:hypothetical protein
VAFKEDFHVFLSACRQFTELSVAQEPTHIEHVIAERGGFEVFDFYSSADSSFKTEDAWPADET